MTNALDPERPVGDCSVNFRSWSKRTVQRSSGLPPENCRRDNPKRIGHRLNLDIPIDPSYPLFLIPLVPQSIQLKFSLLLQVTLKFIF
jgi:hypothetical protein